MASNEEQSVQETLIEDIAEPDRVIETEIPEDAEEASSKILETHDVRWNRVVHEMEVNGFRLMERKQKLNVEAFDNTPKMTLINHSRSIDDRCFDVQKTLTEGKAEHQVIKTEMTKEEVEKFEEDCRNLWNPEADISHFD